jgi:hypothetical protein
MANAEHFVRLRDGSDVWNEWRVRNPNVRVDLSGEDLRDLDLREANLREANLQSALMPVDLVCAKLHKANLMYAGCQLADLRQADLSEANLRAADLAFVNLTGADLRGAQFYEAQSLGTLYADLDLSEVKGLDSVRHFGPSTVGVDTIYKSRGNIPSVFLRGAGVPEALISEIKALISGTEPFQFYSCFISYSHGDKPFALKLNATLQSRGIRCWLDEHQMLPGDDIYDQVDKAIRLSDKVLLCCSRASLTSWWVDNEIAAAFAKEQQLMRGHHRKVLALIPLNLDGYLLSGNWESGKAEQVLQRLAADFTGWESDYVKFEIQVERLIQALRTNQTH